MYRLILLASALAAILFATVPGAALADSEVLQRLTEPRTHALMRHALAPGTGDPANFALDDCSTQRNLNDVGRDQARAIGAALRETGITFDSVLTSQWCRCSETARLLDLGAVADAPSLNSFFADRSTEAAQTRAIRDLLAALPANHTAMLVTHQVNITALTGIFPRSGEIIIVTLGENDTLDVVGRFLIPD